MPNNVHTIVFLFFLKTFCIGLKISTKVLYLLYQNKTTILIQDTCTTVPIHIDVTAKNTNKLLTVDK